MNVDIIIDTLSWYKTWLLNGYNPTHVGRELLRKHKKGLQKFLEPDGKPKVIYTNNSLGFGKACEDLSWNHCTSTPHRSETNGIAERAVRRNEEGTSAVLLQSGLDNEWWAAWNVTAISEIFKISCLMERHPKKDCSEYQLTAQLSRLEQWSNITIFLLKTFRNYINFVLKSCQENSLDMCCRLGESGKKT